MTDPGPNGAAGMICRLRSNGKRAAEQAARSVSDDPLTTFELTQETAPAAFIKGRNVRGKEVTDSAVLCRNLTTLICLYLYQYLLL